MRSSACSGHVPEWRRGNVHVSTRSDERRRLRVGCGVSHARELRTRPVRTDAFVHDVRDRHNGCFYVPARRQRGLLLVRRLPQARRL